MPADPTLADLLKGLWAARFWMIVCGAVFAVAGFVVIAVSTPVYKATMIVAPADGYA